MRRCLIAAAAALVPLPAAAAGLDPEPKAPYRWRVAIRTGSHPAVGPAFRDQLGRELKATLQTTVGAVGTVEVIDLAGPPPDELCRQFVRKGWPALESNPDVKGALDPARLLTGAKTHFLSVEFRDGAFHLEARQHDGFTGITSPVLRRQTTRAADMVARLAGLLIESDFCPVGTVTPEPGDASRATIVLRGHQAGPVDAMVKVGDVFAVSIVDEVPGPTPLGKDGKPDRNRRAEPLKAGTPVGFTLLKVAEPPQDGACKCLVLTRWAADYTYKGDVFRKRPAGARPVGVRAMRVPTVEAKVRLRLVNKDGAPHPRGSLLEVAGTDADFAAKPTADDKFELRDGVYRSVRAFTNVACVTVGIGGGRPQLFPVAVVGPDPVVLLFDLKKEDEERADFVRRCNDLRGRIADVTEAQVALFTELVKLSGLSRIKDAVKRAEGGQAAITQAEQALAEEVKQTRAETAAADPAAKAVLDSCDRSLAAVREGQGRLAGTLKEMQERAEKSGDPAALEREFRAEALAQRIKDQVARGDIPEALETYEDLIRLRPTDQDIKDKRAALLAEWTPKDEEHRKARDALRTWTNARSADELRAAMTPLRAAADTMLRKNDRLGLGKLANTFPPAYAQLQKLVKAADAESEEGAKEIKMLEKISSDAQAVENVVRDHLKQLAKK